MNILLVATDVFEKLILVCLIGLSVWSVAVILEKLRYFRDQKSQLDLAGLRELINKQSWSEVDKVLQSNSSVYASSLRAALRADLDVSQRERLVASEWKAQKPDLEKGLTVLATLGANAPFLGLFGTVLGIIRAFAFLGSQSGSAAVMSGVSQALYATAMGLFVALPAVVYFNKFSVECKKMQNDVESLKDLILALRRSP